MESITVDVWLGRYTQGHKFAAKSVHGNGNIVKKLGKSQAIAMSDGRVIETGKPATLAIFRPLAKHGMLTAAVILRENDQVVINTNGTAQVRPYSTGSGPLSRHAPLR